MDNNSTIVRSSLGRVFNLGDLYDARRDSFVGANIFNSMLPDRAISYQDNPSSKVDFELTDRLSEKFSKLDVNAELQLSVLAGLVNLKGSGNYLSEEKASAKAARMTLLYSITTTSESINIFDKELKENIDLDVIDCLEATHVVVGIEWGANCTVTAEYANQENEKRTKVEGLLKAEMEQISYAIKGQGKTSYEDEKKEYTKEFSFSSNCDIVTTDDELPSSLQQAIEFVKQLPKLVKQSNNGKGKPLSYTLLPLSSIIKYFQFEKKLDLFLKQLREESIIRFVQLFEEISLARQQLYDLHQDVQSYLFCLPDETYQQITEIKNNFAIAESNLRGELNQNLVDIRSGKIADSELETLIKNFNQNDFSPIKIQEKINSFNIIREKIKYIKIFLDKNIEYVGKSEFLEQKIIATQASQSYVFFSALLNKKNLELWNENLQCFISLLNTHETEKQKYQFIIVDCDIRPEYKNEKPKIIHYVDKQLRCENLLKNIKTDANLCLAQSENIETCIYPPNKRVPIKLRCPGSLNGGMCENSTHQWLCYKCRTPLEYGFNNYFYCSCGKSKATTFKYRCNSQNHSSSFISYPEKSLNKFLDVMRPLEEMNILILGETGVGKSTWINAFANYLTYETLEEAEKGELQYVIPSSFTITDDDYQEKLIKIGEDSNERFAVGQSATKEPRAYTLPFGDRIIRLLDTPGIGDVGGIEQDKKNMDNVLAFLTNFEEIHGICILLKPDNARLNVMFQFCIKELLTHLHRSAARNIVFCFTHARSTFFRPGNSLPPLRLLLQQNKNVEITLTKQTIYCMDNESFKFLAASKNNVFFDEISREDYSKSWERSVEENNRLVNHITSLPPHKIQDTLSLNDARRIVVNLTKPITEIARNIQDNIALLEDKKTELRSAKESQKELAKKLYMPIIDLEVQELGYPRTVCTSLTCIDVIQIEGETKKTNYKTHCHEHCYLSGVQTELTNNSALQNCSAMNENNNCRVCGCSWRSHMHITYELYEVEKKIINRNIDNKIKDKQTDQEKINSFIEEIDNRVKEFKKEQKYITEASAKFACFLKQNAITPYNDALIDYLEHLIEVEQRKVTLGGKNETLIGLQRMKDEYSQEVKILEDQMKKGERIAKITPADVKEMQTQLLNLKIKGADLKKIMNHLNTRSSVAYVEYRLPPIKKGRSDGFLSDFANTVLTNAKDALLDMVFPENKNQEDEIEW